MAGEGEKRSMASALIYRTSLTDTRHDATATRRPRECLVLPNVHARVSQLLPANSISTLMVKPKNCFSLSRSKTCARPLHA